MDAKVFVAVWALGYDYMLFTSMGVVFLLALALGYLTKKVHKWRT